jgi:hypothetical protein
MGLPSSLSFDQLLAATKNSSVPHSLFLSAARSRSLNINITVVCLSSMLVFFSMKDISIDKIPVIALHFYFQGPGLVKTVK